MKKTFLGRLLLAAITSQLIYGYALAQIPDDPFVPEPVATNPGVPDQDIPVDAPDQDDTPVDAPDQDGGIPTDPDNG